MTPADLWRLACGLREGHIRIAGPWRAWGSYDPDTGSNPGMYRPTWNGGVAVRTDHSVDWGGGTPTQWAEGSAGLWQPRIYLNVSEAMRDADAFLARTGWILCDEKS